MAFMCMNKLKDKARTDRRRVNSFIKMTGAFEIKLVGRFKASFNSNVDLWTKKANLIKVLDNSFYRGLQL